MRKMLCSRLAKGTFSSLCRAPFSQAQHYFRNKAIRGGASLRWCSSPLPPGWEKMFTPDGIPYYVDHNTKTSQWASPMANQAAHNHLEGDWAFSFIRPFDPHSGLKTVFSLSKGVRRGAELTSLVCVPVQQGTSNLDSSHLAARKAHATGASLNEGVEFGIMPYVEQITHKQVGDRNATKSFMGAPVVVSFDLDAFSKGLIAAEQVGGHVAGVRSDLAQDLVRDSNANLCQSYGFLWEEAGDYYRIEIPRATESSTYQASDDHVVQYLYQTAPSETSPHGGHYIQARKDRVMAHATFRNMFLTDSAESLRWHMALVWPAPLSLSDVMLVHKGRRLEEGSDELYLGYAAQKFLDGDLEVHINGKRVQVLDPQGIAGGGCVSKAFVGFFSRS
jgi:hypothetical protein